MAQKRKTITKKILAGFTVTIVSMYLLACLVPFLNAGKFWFIAMLGLIFPVLLVFIIVCLFMWTIMRSRWVFIIVIALLLSWQQLSVTFAWHIPKDFNTEKKENILRIMSWNVAHLGENFNGLNIYRSPMLDLIKAQNADILCFQEYFEFYDRPGNPVNIPDIEKMGYPYHYFFPTSVIHDGKSQFGLCFFSKFPIINSAEFKEGINIHSEGLCYIDIKDQNQVFRVFTTHLESVGFGKKDYEGLGSIETSGGIFGKIRTSYQIRSMQAEMVRKEINISPYPVIICGDLDDVPNSYAYFIVKGDLQDAFLQSGWALGRTLRFISPTLRIDYILADRKFSVEQFNKIVSPYSDHCPIITDLKIIN